MESNRVPLRLYPAYSSAHSDRAEAREARPRGEGVLLRVHLSLSTVYGDHRSASRSGTFFTGSPGVNAGPEIPPRTSSHPDRRGVARRGAIPDFGNEGITGPSGTNSSSMAVSSSERGPFGA